MRAYWTVLLTTLAAVFVLNSVVDVSGLDTYSSVYELASRQKTGQLLIWERLFDQRAWVKAKLARADACPDVLILGTSTVGALSQGMIPGAKVLNAWMTDTGIEDYEALTYLLENSPCRPRKIVLGVDPWFLVPSMKQSRWISLRAEYAAYRHENDLWNGTAFRAKSLWERFQERLNYDSTRVALRFVFGRSEASSAQFRPKPVLVDDEVARYCLTAREPEYIRSDDGHFTTCPQFIDDAETLRKKTATYFLANAPMRGWKSVDRDRFSRLSAAVARWRARGSAVEIVAPPIYPEAYRQLEAAPNVVENLSAVDALFSSLQKDPGIRYWNLRDANELGCLPAEFNDPHHYKPSCAAKITARVLSAESGPRS